MAVLPLGVLLALQAQRGSTPVVLSEVGTWAPALMPLHADLGGDLQHQPAVTLCTESSGGIRSPLSASCHYAAVHVAARPGAGRSVTGRWCEKDAGD